MTEPHGDDTYEQMDYLDHPVVRAGKQTQLLDAQRWNDQAPDEDEESKPSITGREEPKDGENPQTYDE